MPLTNSAVFKVLKSGLLSGALGGVVQGVKNVTSHKNNIIQDVINENIKYLPDLPHKRIAEVLHPLRPEDMNVSVHISGNPVSMKHPDFESLYNANPDTVVNKYTMKPEVVEGLTTDMLKNRTPGEKIKDFIELTGPAIGVSAAVGAAVPLAQMGINALFSPSKPTDKKDETTKENVSKAAEEHINKVIGKTSVQDLIQKYRQV